MYTLFQNVKGLLKAEEKLYELIGNANMLIWQMAVDFADWPRPDFLQVQGTTPSASAALLAFSREQIQSIAYNGIPLFRFRIDNDLAHHITTMAGADRLLECLKKITAEELGLLRSEDVMAIVGRLLTSQKKRISDINKALWQIVRHLRNERDPLATERFDIKKRHLEALIHLSEFEFHVLASQDLPVFRLNLILDDMSPKSKKEKRNKPLDYMLFMLGKSITGDLR